MSKSGQKPSVQKPSVQEPSVQDPLVDALKKKSSGFNSVFAGKRKLKVSEFLVATFVIGSLAFIFAQAWNMFSEQIMFSLKTKDEDNGTPHNNLFYTGIYVVCVTCVTLAIAIILFFVLH